MLLSQNSWWRRDRQIHVQKNGAAEPLSMDAVWLMRRRPGGEERAILKEVNAEFPPGKLTLLTGATGAGKSTIVHLLSGLLRPSKGTVYAGEAPVSRWVAGHRDRFRRRVGIALQSPQLVPDLTVLENVMLPIVPVASSREQLIEDSKEALRAADLYELRAADVQALSGGQRQRVGFARAIVRRPDFLMLDEPSAHQDVHGTEVLQSVVEAACARGAVVIISSHDPRVVDKNPEAARWHLEDGHLERVQ